MHQNSLEVLEVLLKHQLLGPPPGIFDLLGLAFLTCFYVMLLLAGLEPLAYLIPKRVLLDTKQSPIYSLITFSKQPIT